MNKGGLSDLIATVLIVLLALGAVALIWGFLKPAFERTGSQIDLRTRCLNIEVEPTQCTYNSITNVSTVTVKLVGGEASQVYAVVQYADNKANATRADAPPVLATTNIIIAPPTDSSKQQEVHLRLF